MSGTGTPQPDRNEGPSSLWRFLRRWLRRCPDCGARGCNGTPDSELWTVPGG